MRYLTDKLLTKTAVMLFVMVLLIVSIVIMEFRGTEYSDYLQDIALLVVGYFFGDQIKDSTPNQLG